MIYKIGYSLQVGKPALSFSYLQLTRILIKKQQKSDLTVFSGGKNLHYFINIKQTEATKNAKLFIWNDKRLIIALFIMTLHQSCDRKPIL